MTPKFWLNLERRFDQKKADDFRLTFCGENREPLVKVGRANGSRNESSVHSVLRW